jgi:hypothetical protein
MRVSLVEQAVLNPPAGMEGWRCFRIEYGGHAEHCIAEGVLWVPDLLTQGAEVTHWDGCYQFHPWCSIMREFDKLEGG